MPPERALTPANAMRVLHLTTEFPPIVYGGLGTAVGGMVAASARAGISVGVVLAGHGGQDGYQPLRRRRRRAASDEVLLDSPGGTIFHVGTLTSIEAAIRIVEAWKPDVLHVHPFWLWPAAYAIRQRTGVPAVYHVHSLDRAEYELGDGPPECLTQWGIQQDAIRSADRIIALTGSERDLIAEYCPEARDRIRVVGNGIDDSASARRAAARRHSGDQPAGQPPLVLFAGRFVERKGVRELVAAIPHVLAHAPTTRFVLAGGHRCSSAEEMERWWLPADFGSCRERVHFTGWLTAEQLAGWYEAADVLVVPSWYEPFGMVVLEGMLHGLAIVAADVGGPAEILEHERTGLLCPPRDAVALGEAVLRVLADRGLAIRLGAAAAAEVRRHWLWPAAVERMQSVYRQAVRPH